MSVCECCTATFPEDDGQLGDICSQCGWECDLIEDNGWSSANGWILSEFQFLWRHKAAAGKIL